MKHKAEDVESYETKNKTLIPMKHKIEDVESYETKNRGCSFLWNIKQRTLIPVKHKARGRWVLWN